MNNQIQMRGFVVEVERKRVKNVNLRVYPQQGRVVVSCPGRLPLNKVEKFVNQKHSWITKKLNSHVSPLTSKKIKLENDAKIFLWGESKRLSVEKSEYRHSVDSVTDSTVTILTKHSGRQAKLQRTLDDLYRKEIKERLPEMIQKWESEMNVRVSEFGVKKMKTRWGTCNITAKRIWLNLQLAKWPPECLEFVVVHEMVHLHERLHSKRFYRLMDSYLPDWKDREKILKTFFKSCSC